MNTISIDRIGVIGAGQMGGGIAQVCAIAGIQVVLCDLNKETLNRSMTTLKNSLDRMVAKEKLTHTQAETAISCISTSDSLALVSDADLIIEAVSENEEIKRSIFQQLDAICQTNTILATNTSSISITRLATATKRPKQVIGMHFMNPVPMMRLVEVIRALQTEDAVFNAVQQLAQRIDKTPVDVSDSPGFVANRILLPMINEAIFCLYERLASAEEIDTVMKLGMSHPMGPLALADLIGLDTCLDIMEVLYDGFKDSKYRPCPLLVQMVDAGRLGCKSGRGFYSYS